MFIFSTTEQRVFGAAIRHVSLAHDVTWEGIGSQDISDEGVGRLISTALEVVAMTRAAMGQDLEGMARLRTRASAMNEFPPLLSLPLSDEDINDEDNWESLSDEDMKYVAMCGGLRRDQWVKAKAIDEDGESGTLYLSQPDDPNHSGVLFIRDQPFVMPYHRWHPKG